MDLITSSLMELQLNVILTTHKVVVAALQLGGAGKHQNTAYVKPALTTEVSIVNNINNFELTLMKRRINFSR